MYKNPITAISSIGTPYVPNYSTFGTHFSVYGVGGYMEVYKVSDLYYSIPSGQYGPINYSGNTIPVNYTKSSGGSSFDSLILNSDNISSGRRRLGMLVYVYETDQIYQFSINNYSTLWSSATASTNCVTISTFGTIVRGNTPAGIAFISSWTGNTVEGISGATRSTSVWKKLATGGGGGGSGITGGTYYPNTLTLDLESTGTTISIGNVTGLYISAGTYTSGTSTLNLFNSTGGTISITGITAGSGGGGSSNFQYFISGSSPTGTINNGDRWFYTESGEEFVWITDQNSSQWVQPVSISYGVSEEFVHITGDTMTGTLYVPTISATTYLNIPSYSFSGGTVTGPTNFTNGLSANTISATTYYNLPGSSSSNCQTTFYVTNISGCSPVNMLTEVNMISGLTVTGAGYFTGVVTASTISATTYQNYPTNFTSGLTATTISATTYLNLPTDIRTTGGTYSNNTFTFTNNTGGTYSVLFNTVTGLTVNGNLTTTGTTSSGTISATTYQNLPSQSGTGISSLSYVVTTGVLTLTKNDSTTLTAGTFTYLTGASYSNNVVTFTNNLGSTSNITINTVTGLTVNGVLTVTGNTSLQALTATTISATTYSNLPTDVRVTGATYSNNNFTFTNNTGGTFSVLFNTVTGLTVNGILTVTGNTSLQALTATTISATTYSNLPTDIRTTGGTYSNNNFTFTNNTGGTYSVLFNTVTGLTVNGGLTITGNTSAQGLTATTISATTYQNLPTDITITGASYSNNNFTFTNNIGGTFSVLFNTVTGLTVNGNLTATGTTSSTAFTGNSDTISGTKGSVISNGSTTTAFITVSGSNTIGGTDYNDFIRATNTAAGATNPTKTIRVNITGGIEFLNNAYTAQILTLTDGGVLSVGGGNIAVTSNNDPSANYLSFNNNFTAIYDDGNTHIHSRSNGGSMWINTNNGAIILGNQSPVLGGGAASAIIMGSGSTTTRAYANIYGSKTYTIGSYGYLATIGAGTGGGTTAPYSLYCDNRVEATEFDATSDERLKDIQGEIPLNDAITLVNNLKPIKYTWKNGEDKGIKSGYSAQQVEKAGFRHLIGHIPNEDLRATTDSDGFTSPEGFQLTMNYDQVTPYHGVVIKHLLEEIEALKQEIKELKNKVG